MSRQVWGTFSVKDHCASRAYVADVMLYDRLVIPVPPDDEQRENWDQQGWNPGLQECLLEILGDKARRVPWTKELRERWRSRFYGGFDIPRELRESRDLPFPVTRLALFDDIPRHVTGVAAVTNFPSMAELSAAVNLRAVENQQHYSCSALVAVLGRAFLVPDDPSRSHLDLLQDAVDLSSEPEFTRKRACFWRWAYEFIDDTGVTDQLAIKDAVEEMNDLITDEQKILQRHKIRTTTRYAFLVASITLGLLGGPLTAIGVGGAFVSVGDFLADKLLADKPDAKKPAALFHDIRRHFGWS